MRPFHLVSLLTLAATSITLMTRTSSASPTLVELFTSEGCSSCPPADEYLHDLTATRDAQSGDYIFIEWHVDYWDYLGWKDPFASPAASQRQRDYAGAMKDRNIDRAGVYTPQMIVAGTHAFVGSDRAKGQIALRPSNRGHAAPLNINTAIKGDQLTITARLPDLPKGTTVMGVLVEDGLTSSVTSGENRGKTLTHDRVARTSPLATINNALATATLTIPGSVTRDNASVVLFAQSADMGEILAVGAASLAADTSTERYHTLKIGSGEIRYALILPDDFDAAKTYPAILALPPGAQDESMVEAGLGLYWEQAARKRGWIVVSPINPDSARLFQAQSDPIAKLLDDINARFNIEGAKFHLTGVSNGGRAAFLAALDHPDRYASLTVLPGLLGTDATPQQVRALKDLPIAMFVGADDDEWTAEARRTVETLRKQGIEATLTIKEGQGHVMQMPADELFDLLDTHRP